MGVPGIVPRPMADKLAEQFEMYRHNVTPGMVAVLAGQLGVTSESLTRLGIGWIIIDEAWAFPERNTEGKVIGILRRFLDGQKYMLNGSKRGLAYEVVPITDGYDPSRQTWIRVTKDDPCPICKREKWCGLDGNTDPPRFVKCHHQVAGSKYSSQDGGHIHELVKGSFKPPRKYATPLPQSDLPVIVVEGHSDSAAALDLGFQAVGRPSDSGGMKLLPDLLRGRDVVVIGENDAGAGIKGMEKTFQALRKYCTSVVKVMPPEKYKDLRAWLSKGRLTQADLLRAIDGGSTDSDNNVLESKAPLYIAERWLREEQSVDGVPIVRKHNGEWYKWDGRRYLVVQEDATIRGPLYRFLEGMMVKKFNPAGECSLVEYETTRARVNDIMDAMNMTCPVLEDAPCWLDSRTTPSPSNLISFANGVLDVAGHLSGSTRLIPPTPTLFNTASVPYSFDEGADCPQWLYFLDSVFEGDAERIALAQEWIGYNMIPDTSQEKMMMLVGRPGSGKSTFLDVMQAVIGRNQCVSTTFKDLCGNHGTYSLVNKLAIILPDAHVPRQVDATQALERIKSITGRDRVSVNQKFHDIYDALLVGRFTMAVNELPELPDHVRSLERRLLLIHFPASFEGHEDRTLKDRLPLEAPGIAVWALEGLNRMRGRLPRPRFTEPVSSEPVIEEFRRSMTPVAEFIHECCTEGKDLYVPKRQTYDTWCMWAKDHGVPPRAHCRFGQRFLAQNPGFKTVRRTFAGKAVTCYGGVELTDEAKNRYLARAAR